MSYSDRLDEIEARLNRCRLPWGLYGVGDGPWQINAENQLEGTLAFVAAIWRREEAEFMRHAPDDIAWLVAQLRASRGIPRERGR